MHRVGNRKFAAVKFARLYPLVVLKSKLDVRQIVEK
jgi:hypothetical protein